MVRNQYPNDDPTDRRVFRWLLMFIIAIIAMAILSTISGCVKPDVPRAVGEIPTRLQTIADNAERIKPHANPVGKEFAQAIVEDARATGSAAKVLTDDYARVARDYARLCNDAWVKAAIWIKRAFYTLVISWVVLGILSVVLGVGNPLGWTWRIGKSIRRFLPFANPFGLLTDWLRSRRQNSIQVVKPRPKGKK